MWRFIEISLYSFYISLLLWDFLKFIKHQFPEQYQEVVIYVSFNAIRGASYCQIFINKVAKRIDQFGNVVLKRNHRLNDLFKSYHSKINENAKNVDVIKNGKIIHSTTKKTILQGNCNDNDNELVDASFLIYSEKCVLKDKHIHNKKIISLKGNSPIEEHFMCINSNIKFMLCEAIICDKVIKVNFSNDKNNYFVSGNKYDCEFVLYFLHKYHPNDISALTDEELIEYKIKILDHNVNEITIDKDNILCIDEYDYKIE